MGRLYAGPIKSRRSNQENQLDPVERGGSNDELNPRSLPTDTGALGPKDSRGRLVRRCRVLLADEVLPSREGLGPPSSVPGPGSTPSVNRDDERATRSDRRA